MDEQTKIEPLEADEAVRLTPRYVLVARDVWDDHELTLSVVQADRDDWREKYGTLQDAHEVQRLHLASALERMNAAEAEVERLTRRRSRKRCQQCGMTQANHCDLDEPGLDHKADCWKVHHEFKAACPAEREGE